MYVSTIIPTYYRVTWTGTAYNSLTGDAAGGIDCTSAERINREIWMTNSVSNPTLDSGTQSILINGTEIVFSGTSLSDVANDINLQTSTTNVTADLLSFPGYLTLRNAPGYEGKSFWCQPSQGTAFDSLGLNTRPAQGWPSVMGSGWTNPSNDSYIVINGHSVGFNSSLGLDIAGVASAINGLSAQTNVVARQGPGVLQLASANGQPWTLTEGSAGALAAIGFSAQTYTGLPEDDNASYNKERAIMRWRQLTLDLSQLASPVYFGDFARSATVGSVDPLDTLSFTIAYDRTGYLVTGDELDSDTPLNDVDTIRRIIARSLSAPPSAHKQTYFEPAVTNVRANHVARGNPSQVLTITAAPLDTDIPSLEAAIAVSILS